jgi:membrane-associated protein
VSGVALLAATGLHPLTVFNPLGPTGYLQSAGALAVLIVLFAETGLLIGFFLPGDSLLFAAGLLCAHTVNGHHLSLATVLPAAVVGAIGGAEVGWVIGRRAGPALLSSRYRTLARGTARAREILERYGVGKALVLARFIPVVRTVMNPLAGVSGVPIGTFTMWNLLGGVPWSAGVTLLGYVLGSRIPSIDTYLLPIIAVVVVLSVIPVAVELLRERRRSRI